MESKLLGLLAVGLLAGSVAAQADPLYSTYASAFAGSLPYDEDEQIEANTSAEASIESGGVTYAFGQADLASGAVRASMYADGSFAAAGQGRMTDTAWFDLPDGMDSFSLSITWTVEGINTKLLPTGFCNGTTAFFSFIDGASGNGVTFDSLVGGCAGGIGDPGDVYLQYTSSFDVFEGINYSLLTWINVAGQFGWSADFANTSFFRFEIPDGVMLNSASGVLLTQIGEPPSVPEPGTLALLGLGLAGLGLSRRRKAN